MKKWRFWLLNLCLVQGLMVTSSSWVSCAAEAGWSISQLATGSPINGTTTLLVTPNGMRAYDHKSGICLFTKKPGWQLVMFNSRTRNYYQTSLRSWMQTLQQKGVSSRFDGATWKRGDQGAISGVQAYEFIVDKPPAARGSIKTVDGKSKILPAFTGGSLWVASDIAIPPEVSSLIAKIYGVPDCQRVPLRLSVNESGKGRVLAIDTMQVRHINVPDSMFALPQGYKPVQTDTEVFLDKESMDAINKALKEL